MYGASSSNQTRLPSAVEPVPHRDDIASTICRPRPFTASGSISRRCAARPLVSPTSTRKCAAPTRTVSFPLDCAWTSALVTSSLVSRHATSIVSGSALCLRMAAATKRRAAPTLGGTAGSTVVTPSVVARESSAVPAACADSGNRPFTRRSQSPSGPSCAERLCPERVEALRQEPRDVHLTDADLGCDLRLRQSLEEAQNYDPPLA